MKIFITGGTGFIGKSIIPKLDNGNNKLLLLTRKSVGENQSKNITYLTGSLKDIHKWEEKLKIFNPEAAIHLAWEGIPDYGAENSSRNLEYGLDLFNLLAKTKCRTILTTGSIWEYGKQAGKLFEDQAVTPFNNFTAAKNSLNWMGSKIAKKHNINFIWTRLFYVYGPGQKGTSLIAYLIECIRKGEKPEIRNPNAENDFIYVEDAANAIVKLISEYNQSNIFNIGSGELTSVQTIINTIYDLSGKRNDYQLSKQMPTDILSAGYADISKIEQAINWHPKIDIKKGLKKTLEYVKI